MTALCLCPHIRPTWKEGCSSLQKHSFISGTSHLGQMKDTLWLFALENIMEWFRKWQSQFFVFVFCHRLITACFSSNTGLIGVASDWADRWLRHTVVICFREPPRGPAENAKHRWRLHKWHETPLTFCLNYAGDDARKTNLQWPLQSSNLFTSTGWFSWMEWR